MIVQMIRLARPRHWVKNVIVLFPIIFARQMDRAEAWAEVLLAAAAFCLASAAGYVVNDIRDRHADRLHPAKKDRPLVPEHFAEFERCFGNDPNGRAKRKKSDSKQDRWRKFGIDEVRDRDFKLDGFKWLKDDSLEDADDLPEPEELATDAIGELEEAVGELNAVLTLLENGNGNRNATGQEAGR